METTFATPSTVSKFASLMGTSGANPMVNVFRPKSTGEDAAAATSTGNLSKGVSSAIQAADQLVKNYTTLKVEILDRSDRALWEMIQSVYQFVAQIDRSPTKRDTRNELLGKILKAGQPMPVPRPLRCAMCLQINPVKVATTTPLPWRRLAPWALVQIHLQTF